MEAGRTEAGRRTFEVALRLVEEDPDLDAEDRTRWRERIETAIEDLAGTR